VEMRPHGRIFSTCILFKPVLGLRESAWKEMRSLFVHGYGVCDGVRARDEMDRYDVLYNTAEYR